jgi:hypothetical protein
MRLLKCAVFLACLSYFSLSCAAFDPEHHREQKTTREGMDDDLPKNYALYPFELKDLPSNASLSIDKDGVAKIRWGHPTKLLKELDKATAIKIFGELHFVREDDPCHTFHVLTYNPMQGPNIFHLDMDFDKAQLITRYRVRGFGILKPTWQQVQ